MERKNRKYVFATLLAISSLAVFSAYAQNIEMNTAQMQALDKVSGQISTIEVPVNGEIKFGSFSIVVRKCMTAPQDETPEDYAFVDVADTNREGKLFNIFKGWMLSSSPSLNSIEHPIYDVWLKKCHNQKSSVQLLTDAQLKERDNLEKIKENALSKEAKIAIEVQEQEEKAKEVAKLEQEKLVQKQAEEEEEKLRQNELEKEIQVQQEQQQIEEITSGEGGPVSLLNLGAQAASHETETPKLPDGAKTAIEATPSNTDEATSADTANSVVIEDTHHETIEQDFELPDDISEILPENISKEQTDE